MHTKCVIARQQRPTRDNCRCITATNLTPVLSSFFFTRTCSFLPYFSLPSPIPDFQPNFSNCLRAKDDTALPAPSFVFRPRDLIIDFPTPSIVTPASTTNADEPMRGYWAAQKELCTEPPTNRLRIHGVGPKLCTLLAAVVGY